MLSVTQARTIQWSRDASELDDSTMVDIASDMLNAPRFWTDLKDGQMRSDHIVHDGRNYLVLYYCLSPEDDIVLQIMDIH